MTTLTKFWKVNSKGQYSPSLLLIVQLSISSTVRIFLYIFVLERFRCSNTLRYFSPAHYFLCPVSHNPFTFKSRYVFFMVHLEIWILPQLRGPVDRCELKRIYSDEELAVRHLPINFHCLELHKFIHDIFYKTYCVMFLSIAIKLSRARMTWIGNIPALVNLFKCYKTT